MNIFIGILGALGLAALAYAAVSWARAGKAVNATVGGIQRNGLFASLFPSKGALPTNAQLLAGNTPAYQNPLAWSGAAKDLTQVGISIAKAATPAGGFSTQIAKGSAASDYVNQLAGNDEIAIGTQNGPGISGAEYLAQMRGSSGEPMVINDSSQVID